MFPSARLALAVAVVGSAAIAQLGKPNGTRVEVTTPINSNLRATHDNSYGVIRVPTGEYFVGTAKSKPGFSHKLVKMSERGVVLKSYDQPAALIPADFGLYDLTYVEKTNTIYGGTDYKVSRKLHAFDVKTGKFESSKSITIPAGVPGAAARALTYNPDGNAGKGTFWIGDGASKISEITVDGKLLRTLNNVHPTTQAAAFDDEAQLVWWFGVGGTTRKDQGVVGIAMDAASGKVTTLKVLGDNTIPGGNPMGGQVRGAQIWEAGGTDHEDLWMLVLTDAEKDWFYEMHAAFVVEDGCSGKIGFDGDACYAGNLAWGVTLRESKASVAALTVASAELLTGLPLPFPFKPGCLLHPKLDADFIIFPPTTVSAGNGRQAVAIPPLPALIGKSMFFQWFEVESSGRTPLSMSEEGEAYIHN